MLFYALDKDTNKPKHISNVSNGLDCNCVCPDCNEQLIAKKGDIQRHHFAHHNPSRDGSTGGCGLESMIHLVAKEVISKMETISFSYLSTECIAKGLRYEDGHNDVNFDQTVTVKTLELEKQIKLNTKNFGETVLIPDVYVEGTNGRKFAIEVFYKHKIDGVKILKYKEAKISVFELDLSDLEELDLSSSDEAFVKEINRRLRSYPSSWVYNDELYKVNQRVNKLKEYYYKGDIANVVFCPKNGEKYYSDQCYSDCNKLIGQDSEGYRYCLKRLEESN